MNLGIEGKVALVTGASAGIGRETALVLAEEGAKLVLVARRKSMLEQVAKEVAAACTQKPLVIPLDLAEPRSAAAVHEVTDGARLHVDIVVNSAGGSRPLSLDAGENAWEEAFAVNFTALRRITSEFLDGMIANRWGRIINITGTLEPKGLNAANAAKAAVHAWAKGVSIEVAKYGVTINSISPGRIMSEQIKRLYPTDLDRDKFAKGNIPMGRFGDPKDAANVVAFLASERGSYITGEIIHVDGGLRRSAF